MRSTVFWLLSSCIAVLSMRALAEARVYENETMAIVGYEASSVPDNLRAIILGLGIMSVAYTYWRTWQNFKATSKG